MAGLNVDQAVARALQEPTLVKALSFIAIWDNDRAVHQAIEWKRTGVSTASHGGGWDTCFEYLFEHVLAAWEAAHAVGIPVLVTAEAELLEDIKASNGAEIHRDDWPVAEALVARGLITLGGARGPNRDWRRAEVV